MTSRRNSMNDSNSITFVDDFLRKDAFDFVMRDCDYKKDPVRFVDGAKFVFKEAPKVAEASVALRAHSLAAEGISGELFLDEEQGLLRFECLSLLKGLCFDISAAAPMPPGSKPVEELDEYYVKGRMCHAVYTYIKKKNKVRANMFVQFRMELYELVNSDQKWHERMEMVDPSGNRWPLQDKWDLRRVLKDLTRCAAEGGGLRLQMELDRNSFCARAEV